MHLCKTKSAVTQHQISCTLGEPKNQTNLVKLSQTFVCCGGNHCSVVKKVCITITTVFTQKSLGNNATEPKKKYDQQTNPCHKSVQSLHVKA